MLVTLLHRDFILGPSNRDTVKRIDHEKKQANMESENNKTSDK